MPDTPAYVSTLSVVALTVVCLAFHRTSQRRTNGKHSNDSAGSGLKRDLLQRKSLGISSGTALWGNGVCEGLLDLIRGQAPEETEKEIGPLMSREELSEARIVVVVIGPASTKVYQVLLCNGLPASVTTV